VTATIAGRVAKGAAFLDEREPGWWQRIDLDTLDLMAPCLCVLGQLATSLPEPTWGGICVHFGLEPWRQQVDDLGFNTAGAGTPLQYANLTAVWRRLIEARRAGEPR
jgi:hypothetical protein